MKAMMPQASAVFFCHEPDRRRARLQVAGVIAYGMAAALSLALAGMALLEVLR